MLSKLIDTDIVSREVKFHHSCKSAYLLMYKRNSELKGIIDDNVGDLHACKSIHEYIEKSIIADKRSELLTSVYERYLDFCFTANESPMYKSSLMRNIDGKFQLKLKVQCPAGKKVGSILYNAEIAIDSVRVAYDYSEGDERILNKAALLLRKHLLNSQKKTSLQIQP